MIVRRNKFFANPLPGTVQEQKINAQEQQRNSMIPANPQLNPGNESGGEVTMRDLQLEQARLRRQQIEIQHQKSQLLLKDEISRRRNMVQMQRLERDEKQSQTKARLQAKKEENSNNDEAGVKNTSLYKTRPKAVQPIGMPKK